VAQITQGHIALETFVPLFSHMFVHGGWLHIIGNMVYLWIFGDNIEDRLGSGAYFVFYMLCGIAAAIGQGLVQPESMVGASGAIAGVLGAYVVLFPAARISTLVFLGIFITIVQLPALVVIGFFIVLQVIDALGELRLTAHQATQNIAYFAHIFGFVAGIFLLLLLRQRREQGRFRFG
jgi:membrane associated rhomboid family serine protease